MDSFTLSADQESRTRDLLQFVGLPFEQACLEYHENTTGGTVQVREKIHNRSVYRWKCFEQHLVPLMYRLEENGIAVNGGD